VNLPELAEESAARLGERRELVFEGQDYTNLQFLDESCRLRRSFAGLGLGRGEVAAVCLLNNPVVFPVFQGIFRTGAIAVPVMFTLTPHELRHVLGDCRARGVVTDEASIEKIREIAPEVETLKWIVIVGGQDDPNASVPEYGLAPMLANAPDPHFPAIDPDDAALMLYTSGTTGKSKGVVLSHRNLVHAARAAVAASELERYDRQIVVNALPMAHIFGLAVMNTAFLMPRRLAHSYIVQMPWFDTEPFMQLIQTHRATTITVVPTMLVLLLHHPKIHDYDLTSLVDVVSGAAPLSVELGQAFARLADIGFVREIYGCTECAGMGSSPLASEPFRPGSAGKAYMGMELKIVDEAETPLGPEERGEILVKGPAVMKGYLNRPEETAAALRDGWLHTGDIGYLDDEGYLYIVDRKKDMIIRAGENIYPCELEEIFYAHAAVAEAAVVGTPDPVYGEKVVAFVVLKPGIEATEKELLDFVKTRTAEFKAPSKICFIEAIPKSLVGKVLKRELRETLRAEQGTTQQGTR